MATYVLVICTLCVLAFASEKPTYEEILIAAKAGEMPNSVPKGPDRVDSRHDLVGMKGILIVIHIRMLFLNHMHTSHLSLVRDYVLIYVTMYS